MSHVRLLTVNKRAEEEKKDVDLLSTLEISYYVQFQNNAVVRISIEEGKS